MHTHVYTLHVKYNAYSSQIRVKLKCTKQEKEDKKGQKCPRYLFSRFFLSSNSWCRANIVFQ